MKTVILAGGFGTRISEESHLKPKPMIEIGEHPILWHIMKIYAAFGYKEFIICLGYKGYVIKEFFADYYLHTSDVTFNLAKNEMRVHHNSSEDWVVTLVDTGLDIGTGGRVKRIREYVDGQDFFLTYGDGVADVNIPELEKFHGSHGRIATITTIYSPPRFGVIDIREDGQVSRFREKSDDDSHMINGGFMVLKPEVFNYIENDADMLERVPFDRLSADGEMMAYKHSGFWQCMDTQRDKQLLETLWKDGKAPWKIW